MSNKKYFQEEDICPNKFVSKAIRVIIFVVMFALFLYAVFSFINVKLNLLPIALPSLELTTKGLVTALFVLLFAYYISKKCDYSDSRLKYIYLVLIIIATTLVQIYMSYIMYLTSFAPLLLAAQYSNKKLISFAYILSVISSVFIVFASYSIGLCDANLVIFPTQELQHYGSTLTGNIIPLSEAFPSLLSLGVLPRIILITALTPLIISIVGNRKEIILNEYHSRYVGEHDAFTGVYNRAKYNALLENEFSTYETVSVAFFDVNNLKYTNDNFGHDVGDKLILSASRSLQLASTEDMYVFRFGGDEFLVVIPNGDQYICENFIEKWKIALKHINETSEVECEIAYGYSSKPGTQFQECLREADTFMYKNKMERKLNRPIRPERNTTIT